MRMKRFRRPCMVRLGIDRVPKASEDTHRVKMSLRRQLYVIPKDPRPPLIASRLVFERPPQRQFEATRAAELLALNQRLQANLLEVGRAHRLAACSTLARDGKEERYVVVCYRLSKCRCWCQCSLLTTSIV